MNKLLLLVLFVSTNLFADARIEKAFSEFYYSGPLSARHCGQNVASFMRELSRQGLLNSKVRVVSFKAPDHSWSFGNIVAVNSRWGERKGSSMHQNWSFHVIAIVDGKVLDFSFDQKPRPLPVRQYLKEMFIPKEPILLNGESFRVRGKGPYYTPAYANDELAYYVFKTMTSDSHGNFNELKSGLGLAEFLECDFGVSC